MTQFAKETLPISLEEEMRRSYLDYAMSVIVGRALPDARDGLKPVQPVLAESAILYVQRGGLNVREYVFAFEKQVYVSPIGDQAR